MIRKAVIMAAGKGVRMMPLTKLVPKPLIHINGKPFLYHLLIRLKKAGYSDYAIIVGHKGSKVKSFLQEYGFKARLIHQDKRLGTAHALKLASKFTGHDQFIALGGDSLWSVPDLRKISKDDKLSYVATTKVKDWKRYGIIVEKKGYLSRIVEKPKKFVGNQINTGLYKFTPEIYDAIAKIGKSSRGEYELTDALTLLAKGKKIRTVKCQDAWIDMGCPEDIPLIDNYLKGAR
ncbi:NTP transferase domain-containing protein [Candidatus Woesearchaeota archaeon]|nr:NTP transferase domain-containing protein [Candidatus Woesearchaeota archaeon]